MRSPEPVPRGAIRALGMCLGIASVLVALTAYRLLQRDSWHTGARVVAWVGPAGTPVVGAPGRDGLLSGCRGDAVFETLSVGDALWTLCRGVSAFPAGAFARIEPAHGIGLIRWPLPKTLAIAHTVAVVPGPGGQVAFIYRARAVDGPLVLGVAADDGWRFFPTELAGQEYSRLLGAAWIENDLEVAMVSGAPGDRLAIWRDVTMLSLHADNSVRTRPVPLRPMCVRCSAKAAYRSRGAWRFLLQDEGNVLTDVSSIGDRKVSAYAGSAFAAPRGLDLTLSGLLLTGKVTKRLEPDGSVGEPPKVPSAGSDLLTQRRHYARVADRLWWTPRWYGEATLQWVGGRLLVATRKQVGGGDGVAADDVQLVLSDATNPAQRRDRTVARVYDFSCGSLYSPAVLPRASGGYWLVATDGCYLAVDDNLARADPLGLSEHLARRGSVFLRRIEPRNVYYLAWMLAGLPLCLALAFGAGLARCRGGRCAREPVLIRYAITATMLFTAIGGVVLFGALWPLLR